MNHIYWYPHSKEAEFYKLLLDYDESLERDLADCRAIWYESWTQNLMVWNYWMPDRIVSMIISKQFWFIKWLVENDKIDTIPLIDEFRLQIKLNSWSLGELWWADRILMLLAISENPIEDLISYLK